MAVSASPASVLGTGDHAKPLHVPDDPQATRTYRFLQRANAAHGLGLQSYFDLWKWSTTEIDAFWGDVWDETGVIGHKGAHVVDKTALPPANPPWFKEAKLNWAENMLRNRSSEKVAIIEATEPTPSEPSPPLRRVTYAELYALVADLVSALLSVGLKPGDRVASYSSNCIENMAACLAATAIGGVRKVIGVRTSEPDASADGPPFPPTHRFEQVRPSLIFSVEAVVYNAKVHPHAPKLKTLLEGLRARTGLAPRVVVAQHPSQAGDRSAWDAAWTAYGDFVDAGKACKLGRSPEGEIEWARLGFDHPLWILFSSGTTGAPIVHRAGGMLLQMQKELGICADLKPDDVYFYYTTTGWMMWNYLVSGLALGCTLVMYDGSPLRDPAYLWNLVDELGITIYGTSAKYLDGLAKCYKEPKAHHSLSTLRHIYSTGSPLGAAQYDFVYEQISPNVLLGSITGGTDICSLFAGMNSMLPVYRGEVQCRMLGMAIEAFTPAGTPAEPGLAGELVCVRPFPCQPVGFWPLPGYGSAADVAAAQDRYQQAYFAEYKGVWYHGDHVIVTPSRGGNGGGLIMLGRSDGVLNPGGVRFGSAELYDVIDLCFAPEASHHPHTIVDCLAVGQSIAQHTDERVILFVKLLEGEVLSDELQKRIKNEIRARRSARHVPAKIIQVQDVPYTLTGKRVEVPVKKIINGASISSVNPATLKNPECLAEYEGLGVKLRAEVEGN
ncbi:hypothetical protein EIP86_001768 [Pleurotus ostreatoroseus]|nr:hypothetical protein EIP86_001768 [Pleurotus ostreatoroseus]